MTARSRFPVEQTVNIDPASRLKSDTRQTNWRRQNPNKYAAHIAVQRALSQGKLMKQPCEVCGAEVVDAHHDDYSKPLKVRWLCRTHHTRLHKCGEDMFATDQKDATQ